MDDLSNHPIGIFDSGVGGLTVANAIKNILPSENLVYFGDTAHLPYGDKSPESIRYYSEHISQFLIEKNCKLILIACNTASAHAGEMLRKELKGKALVMDVISPVVDYIGNQKKINKLGVIGTKGTIQSGTYTKMLLDKKPDIQVYSKATPLLAPMIEEGFIYDDISNAIIRAYLNDKLFAGIDAMILACTHYPIIKNQIRKFFDFNLKVIDSAEIVAKALKKYLQGNKLLSMKHESTYEFYVSDHTELFEKIANIFFEDEIHLQKKDLWLQE